MTGSYHLALACVVKPGCKTHMHTMYDSSIAVMDKTRIVDEEW